MNVRYRSVATATWLLILPCSPVSAKDKHQPAATKVAPAVDLYSARALRRARAILELRLLELKAERLACVRAALERTLLGRPTPIGRCAKQSQALIDR